MGLTIEKFSWSARLDHGTGQGDTFFVGMEQLSGCFLFCQIISLKYINVLCPLTTELLYQ